MRKKRFSAFCLACLMLLNSGAGFFDTVVKAADNNRVTLSFVNSNLGESATAEIIRGNSIGINIVKPSNVLQESGEKAWTIVRSDSTEIKDGDVTITGTTPTSQRVTVNDEMTINGDVTLTIKGNYYSQPSSGTCVETAAGELSPIYSDFALDPPLSVFQYSTATLTCTGSESDGTPPSFSFLVGDSDPQNAFSEFAENVSVSVAARKNTSENLIVHLSNGKNASLDITLKPKQPHKIKDEFGNVIKTDYYVQAGTKFLLSLAGPQSNELMLRVLTPEKACQEIATEIAQQKGEPEGGGSISELSYIRLAADNSLNFIDTPFELQPQVNRYGADFKIDWVWTPTISDDAGVISIPTSVNPKNWLLVGLNRKYEDAEGKLQATVTYGSVTNPSAALPIKIHGTGQPASVSRVSQWVKESPEDVGDLFADPVMPSQVAMDVYDGHINGIQPPTDPYKYQIQLNMGKDNAASQYAIVSLASGNAQAVSMQTIDSGNKLNDYSFGAQIANPNINGSDEGKMGLIFTARPTGEERQILSLKVTFYVKGNNNKLVEASSKSFQLIVNDSSPSDDNTLKSLTLKGKLQDTLFFAWKDIDYGFASNKTTYDISLTNDYESITLNPTRNDPNADKNIQIKVTTAGGTPDYQSVTSGSTSTEIPLAENVPVKVEVTVTAENLITKTYTLNIMRMPPSADSTLKSLTLYDESGKELFNGIKKNVFEYDVEIPFKVQKTRVAYVPNHEKATAEFLPALVDNGLFTKTEWLDIATETKKSDSGREMTLTVTMTPENKNESDKSIYTLNITRTPPSDVNTLSELTVMDSNNKTLPYTPAFHANMDEEDYYELKIPYSTGKIRVQAKPTDSGATMILKGKGIGGLLGGDEQTLGANTPSKPFEVSPYDESIPDDYFNLVLEVWPESVPVGSVAEDSPEYQNKVLKYPIHVYRDPPSKDATLKSLVVADQDGKEIAYDFDPEITKYTVEVPYEVQKVKFTPTAAYDYVSKIMINNRKVNSGETSSLFTLNSDTTTNTEFTITVTPEDTEATPKVYTVIFKRLPPSSDARLIKLEAGNATDFQPVFMPSKTSYTAKVAAGAEGVTITATANDPNAKIKIDGKSVESGKASELIRILEETQKVSIVVTAQDGKTQMTYTITFTNENYIQKNSNADLKRLEVQYGEMRPAKFKPSVTDYEVSVDEETYSVELLPKTDDKYATMKVYSGTKEIGDYDENYASAIQDGENEFTIEVTSSDGTKKKDYVVTVYRGDEDKMGTLTPITTDDIDFEMEDDLILVDISKYSRVGRDVFEKLKEYPEKTIIFQGNDYSLQFNSKDLDEVIPHVDYFDFGMSFDSPLQDEIMDEIDSHGDNEKARVVLIYFKYHGDLPAPATLTMNLGRRYSDEKMYWYYYNEDYQRMDYYGSFTTNSRGAFSVTLDHMSTYAASDRKLSGAENRTQGQTDVNLSSKSQQEKINPNTGGRQYGL